MTATLSLIDLLLILALTLIFALAIAVYIHNRRSPINRLFSLFLVNVTVWLSLTVVYYLFRPLLPYLLAAQTAIGSFMGLTFYYFSRAMADETFRLRRWEWAMAAFPAGIAAWYAVIAATPALFDEFSRYVWYEGTRLHRPGDLPYIAYTVWQLAAFVMGYAVMVRGLRSEKNPQARKRIRHVLVASVLGPLSILAMTNVSSILGMGQIGWYALLPILGSLGWIAISIIRDRIWKVEYLLEMIRRSEEKLGERNRIIEADLELARQVQKKLLPEGVPSVPGLEVHAVYQPVEKVGGDYYDFIEDDCALGIIIADVSGHGIASAFLSSIIKMGFHYHGGKDGPALFDVLDKLVADKGARAMFATALFCWVDRRAMTLTFCRAGHCPPVVINRVSRKVVFLESPGRALGMNIGAQKYQNGMTALVPGDRLLLYTDGVIETMDPGGALFGEERLVEFLRRGCGLTLDEFCSGLLADLDAFAGGRARGDDITFVAVDVTG